MRVVFGHSPRDQGAIIPNLGWLHQTIAIGALIGWSCTILRSPASSPIPLTRARRIAGLTVNHTAAGRLGHDSPTACARVVPNRGPSVGGPTGGSGARMASPHGHLCGFAGSSFCASFGHSLSTTTRISSEVTVSFSMSAFLLGQRRPSEN